MKRIVLLLALLVPNLYAMDGETTRPLLSAVDADGADAYPPPAYRDVAGGAVSAQGVPPHPSVVRRQRRRKSKSRSCFRKTVGAVAMLIVLLSTGNAASSAYEASVAAPYDNGRGWYSISQNVTERKGCDYSVGIWRRPRRRHRWTPPPDWCEGQQGDNCIVKHESCPQPAKEPFFSMNIAQAVTSAFTAATATLLCCSPGRDIEEEKRELELGEE